MSVTIWFTRVTPEQLSRAEADPEWAGELVDELAFDPLDGRLDRTWSGIEFLTRRAGVNIDILMDGMPIDDAGSLYSWDVASVARAAATLRGVPFDRLAPHYDVATMNEQQIYPNDGFWDADELDYLKSGYETLVHFFDTAAASRSAAIMCHSF